MRRSGRAGRPRTRITSRLAAGIGALAVAGLALAPVALAVDPSGAASAAAPSSQPAVSGSASGSPSASPSSLPSPAASPVGSGSIDKPNTPIEHLVVLMQENHTFDNYFGTYPGADGIPADVCMPIDPSNTALGCIRPHHLTSHRTIDLNHGSDVATLVENGGKYDNFVLAQNQRNLPGETAMGYYDGSDLPFYWNLASQYTLGDRFFSSDVGGSRENHMFWVAGQGGGGHVPSKGYNFDTIFDRLEAAGISWKFYVQNYDPTINYRSLTGDAQDSQTIWVPLVDFDRFIDDPVLNSRIVDISEYRTDLANGTLPAVSFMVPSGASEHPPGDVTIGQVYGASQATALIQSSSWSTSAFVLLWDDWGGWYDHVVPPRIDANGYGLRVPALFVSPFTTAGRIDSTTYDFTSILRFIEDNWDVQPLTARDASANSIAAAFDFTVTRQSPRLPEPTYPGGVTVSPSARLALIAVYGLIVLGVPAGGFLAWRRRPAVLRAAPAVSAQPVVGAGAPAPVSVSESAAAALAATTIGASGPAAAAPRDGRLLRRVPITAPPPVPAIQRSIDPPATIPARAKPPATGARAIPVELSYDTEGSRRPSRPTRVVTATTARADLAPAKAAGSKRRGKATTATSAERPADAVQPSPATTTRPASAATRSSRKSRANDAAIASTADAARPTRRRGTVTAAPAPLSLPTTPPDDADAVETRSPATTRRGPRGGAPAPEPSASMPSGSAASGRKRGRRPSADAFGTDRTPASPAPEQPTERLSRRGRSAAPRKETRTPAASPDTAPQNGEGAALPATVRRRRPAAASPAQDVLPREAPPDSVEASDTLDNARPQTAESRSARATGPGNRSPLGVNAAKRSRRRSSPPAEDPN